MDFYGQHIATCSQDLRIDVEVLTQQPIFARCCAIIVLHAGARSWRKTSRSLT